MMYDITSRIEYSTPTYNILVLQIKTHMRFLNSRASLPGFKLVLSNLWGHTIHVLLHSSNQSN